jgi:hypothetical protein
MTIEGIEQLSVAHLPQTHCLVIAPAGKGPAIGAEGQRADPVIAMAVEGIEQLPTARLPQTYCLVTTATKDNYEVVLADRWSRDSCCPIVWGILLVELCDAMPEFYSNDR